MELAHSGARSLVVCSLRVQFGAGNGSAECSIITIVKRLEGAHNRPFRNLHDTRSRGHLLGVVEFCSNAGQYALHGMIVDFTTVQSMLFVLAREHQLA